MVQGPYRVYKCRVLEPLHISESRVRDRLEAIRAKIKSKLPRPHDRFTPVLSLFDYFFFFFTLGTGPRRSLSLNLVESCKSL